MSSGIQRVWTVSSGELYGDNLGETGGIALPPTELVVNEGTTGTRDYHHWFRLWYKKGKVLLGPDGKTKLKIAPATASVAPRSRLDKIPSLAQ